MTGKYLWDIFVEINSRISRTKEGVCYLIAPSEYLAWSKITDKIVYSWEYDILMDMDCAFTAETNLEFAAQRAIADEKRKAEIEANRGRG